MQSRPNSVICRFRPLVFTISMLSLPGLSVAEVPAVGCPEGYSSGTSSTTTTTSSSSSSGSPSGTVAPPQCDVYSFVVNARGNTSSDYNQANAATVEGLAALTGPATDVSCIADAITWCSDKQLNFGAAAYDGKVHSAWNSNGDYAIWQGEDCIGNYLGGAYGGQYSQGVISGNWTCNSFAGCGFLVDAGTYLFDNNCNIVSNPSSGEQCSIGYTFWWSPISLLWEEGASIDDHLAIVQFPLNIGSSKQWYTWKASSSTPLLVYDPEHKGEVTSPTQLFGNWTFGGQRTAFATQLGNGAQVMPRPWQDGYEALATLDIDHNGELAGEELTPLALWFDSNQDGKSQAGEVRPALDLEINKIFVTPNRRDPASKEIFADRGFERRTSNGKVFTGKSVDWYGEPFSNQLEAVAMMQARNDLLTPVPATLVQSQPNLAHADSTAAKLNGSLKGIWSWQADSGDLGSYQPTGVLSLQDDGRNISGKAYVEVPLKKAQGRVARIIKRNTIEGERTISATGELIFRFNLTEKSGAINLSEATLSPDGRELRGQTTAYIKVNASATPVPVTYRWIAKRAS